MDNLSPLQKIWDDLLSYTPNQDPLILSLALAFVTLLVVSIIWLLLRPKKAVKKASKTEKAAEKIQPAPAERSPDEQAVSSDVAEIRSLDRGGWLQKLHSGLARTRGSLVDGIAKLISSQDSLGEEQLDEIHELLFRADLGVETADKLVDAIRTFVKEHPDAGWDEIKKSLENHVLTILESGTKEESLPTQGPRVILIVGVNGVGKTTSIGKLGAHFMAADKKVLLCAADTYRAAAIDQLQVWGERLGCDVVKHNPGADPASVAYDGVKAAISRKCDILLVDTAGRLHNKVELMDELGKIKRVIGKDLPGAPHETWLVIDATTGQNAFQQVKAFSEVVDLSGLVVTKLDGTAKGGVVIGVTDRFGLPIRYIGVGEKAADLRGFEPQDFASSLF